MAADPSRRADLLPLLVLGILLALMLGGWLLFPVLAHYVSTQDCVALGHTGCG